MRVGGMHGGLGWQVHTEVRMLGRRLQHRELYPVSAARRPTAYEGEDPNARAPA